VKADMKIYNLEMLSAQRSSRGSANDARQTTTAITVVIIKFKNVSMKGIIAVSFTPKKSH